MIYDNTSMYFDFPWPHNELHLGHCDLLLIQLPFSGVSVKDSKSLIAAGCGYSYGHTASTSNCVSIG